MGKKCKFYEDLIFRLLSDDISASERDDLNIHVMSCKSCRDKYAFIRKTGELCIDTRPRLSEEYWDMYSDKLNEKLDRIDIFSTNTEEEEVFVLKRKYIPFAASFLIIIGFLGAFLLKNSHTREFIKSTAFIMDKISPEVSEYFDKVKPLLIDYSVESSAESSSSDIIVDKEVIRGLLKENRLLRKIVAKQNNMSVREVIDTLELILLELDSDNPDKGESAEAVKALIKNRDLLFKIGVLKEKKREKII